MDHVASRILSTVVNANVGSRVLFCTSTVSPCRPHHNGIRGAWRESDFRRLGQCRQKETRGMVQGPGEPATRGEAAVG